MQLPRQKVQELRANTITDNGRTGMSYEELVKSNWGFISAEAQEKVMQSGVLLAGYGLGSNIAVLGARSGFTKFVLADGDRVDPGPVLYWLNETACMQGKPVFFPLNIGFGGAVLVFCPTSSTLEQMLASGDKKKPEEFFLRLVEKLAPFLPSYLQEHMAIRERVSEEDVAGPRLGTAAYLTTALTVTTMIRLTLGIPIETAPYPITRDSWESAKYNFDN